MVLAYVPAVQKVQKLLLEADTEPVEQVVHSAAPVAEKLPAGHRSQPVVAAVEYDPCTQGVQCVESAEAAEPGGHLVQLEAPFTIEKYPTGQTSHSEDNGLAKVPAGQTVHVSEPNSDTVPGGHIRQVLIIESPVTSNETNMPAGHGV